MSFATQSGQQSSVGVYEIQGGRRFDKRQDLDLGSYAILLPDDKKPYTSILVETKGSKDFDIRVYLPATRNEYLLMVFAQGCALVMRANAESMYDRQGMMKEQMWAILKELHKMGDSEQVEEKDVWIYNYDIVCAASDRADNTRYQAEYSILHSSLVERFGIKSVHSINYSHRGTTLIITVRKEWEELPSLSEQRDAPQPQPPVKIDYRKEMPIEDWKLS